MDRVENRAQIYFHDELNDLLHKSRKNSRIGYLFVGHPSVKHIIEALGVPHTEVGVIFSNGQSVDFDYQVLDDDEIEVFPANNKNRHITISQYLQQKYYQNPRFILDNHLGKLATYMRMLGFDAAYSTEDQDVKLAEISQVEGRILLTRDRHLLMRKKIRHGYLVRNSDPKEQLLEIMCRYDLERDILPFNRCLLCNELLISVSKDEINHRLLPLTRRYYNEFRACQNCDHIYWKGSHYEQMRLFVEDLIKDISEMNKTLD